MTDTGETMGLREAVARAQVGWLYVSDDGIEWSAQHPVRSGQVPDARLIRRATHAELLRVLKEAWEAHGEAVQGEAEYARRWRETADAQQARIAELEGALEPFAKVAEHYEGDRDADLVVVDLGQCRTARAALLTPAGLPMRGRG